MKDNRSIRKERLQKELSHEGAVIVKMDISYPRLGPGYGKLASRRLTAYYRRLAAAFRNYCQRQLKEAAKAELLLSRELGVKFTPFSGRLDYVITMNSPEYLSLYCDRLEDRGPNGSHLWRYSETWKFKGGYFVELKSLFPGVKGLKRKVIGSAIKAAEENLRMGTDIYYRDYPELMRKHYSSRRFYLTDKGVYIYYQPCTIGPRDEGAAVFPIALTSGS